MKVYTHTDCFASMKCEVLYINGKSLNTKHFFTFTFKIISILKWFKWTTIRKLFYNNFNIVVSFLFSGGYSIVTIYNQFGTVCKRVVANTPMYSVVLPLRSLLQFYLGCGQAHYYVPTLRSNKFNSAILLRFVVYMNYSLSMTIRLYHWRYEDAQSIIMLWLW